MYETSNIVFFGCNYNDKAIKRQFDSLKKKIESDTPMSCIVIDKRAQKSAKDLWVDIQTGITDSAGCFFDVTAFRPNVVLELGYALGQKNNSQLFITFRERVRKGQQPYWLLSDIGHLNRHPYKNLVSLENFVRSQISQLPYFKNYQDFRSRCNKTSVPDKYKESGLIILQTIRDEGDKTDEQIKSLLQGTGFHINKMISLLKSCKLMKRRQGRRGRWFLPKGN